jgi:hypothetical protein
MADEPRPESAPEAAAAPDWQQALETLERGLLEASKALVLLRRTLGPEVTAEDDEPGDAAPTTPAIPLADAAALFRRLREVGPAPAEGPMAPADEFTAEEPESGDLNGGASNGAAAHLERPDRPAASGPGASAFDRLWDRIERERMERQAEDGENAPRVRRGLDLLPQQYLMTVEDREGSVDLVPLHRALLGVDGVEEVSLISYANGVPVISVRATGELDLDQLGQSVVVVMDRECEVIPQDNGKVYLRLRARQS